MMRTPLVLAGLLLTVTVLAPTAPAAAKTNPVWEMFLDKWNEAWEDKELPATATIDNLRAVAGQLDSVPQTLAMDDFLAMVKARTELFPVEEPALFPAQWEIAGKFNPQITFLGTLYLGLSIFDCGDIDPASGITNVPNVNSPAGPVQKAGTVALDLGVTHQIFATTSDLRVYPSPAIHPILVDGGEVRSDVMVLHPESFAICFLFFGIPLLGIAFLWLDGNLRQ